MIVYNLGYYENGNITLLRLVVGLGSVLEDLWPVIANMWKICTPDLLTLTHKQGWLKQTLEG